MNFETKETVKDKPPVCECGKPATQDGNYWICSNPACRGWGQILREVRR